MTFDKYQAEAYYNALPSCKNLNYMLLGLGNEAGEVQGKFKKVLRGDATEDSQREAMLAELGDVLWYLSGAATVLGAKLEDIAEDNLKKLHDRRQRGVLQGNGDKR